MNFKNTLAKFSLVAILLLILSTGVNAQLLPTVYVDYTNGANTNLGDLPIAEVVAPLGAPHGPVKTIEKGLTLVEEGGTLVIAAVTTGLYEYDDGTGTDVITIDKKVTLKATILVSGGATYTEVGIPSIVFNDASDPKGPFTITSDGTAYFKIKTAVTLTSGNVAIANAADFQLNSGVTMTVAQGASAFSNLAPQKGTDLTLIYNGTANATAGPESKYVDYGAGTITFNNPSGLIKVVSDVTCAGIAVNNMGNAEITGNVTLGTNDIVVTAGDDGDLTIIGNVNFSITDGVGAGNIGQVQQLGGGVITINGTTTWTSAVTAARDFEAVGVHPVVNDPDETTGAIVMGALVFNADEDGDINVQILNEASTDNGNLTVGAVSAPITDDNYVLVSLYNNSTGVFKSGVGDIRDFATNNVAGQLTFTGTGTIAGDLTNTSTGKINVQANVTVGGIFTDNGAAGEVKLTGANLTLTATAARTHVTNTGSFTGTGALILAGAGGAKTIQGGTISNLTVASGATGYSNITNALSISGNLNVGGDLIVLTNASVGGTMTVSGGTFTLGSTLAAVNALVLTLQDFSQTGGIIAMPVNGDGDDRTFDLNGNFSRTGGQFSVPGIDSWLKFTSGTANQTFNPGASLKIGNVVFDSPFKTITVQQSFEVVETGEITENTIVELSNYNINLTGGANATTSSTFTNNGFYTSTASGGIQFLGQGAVGGHLKGYHPYSNIIISSLNDVAVDDADATPGHDVTWTGTLTLNTAGIDVNDNVSDGNNVDFSPSGTSAKIVRNLASATTVITPATDGTTMATFNNAGVDYNLEYFGTLTAHTNSGSEFDQAHVRDFTVNTVKTGANFEVRLPGGANITIKGDLTVGKDAILSVLTGALTTLTLSKESGNHTVRGIVTFADAADKYVISGDNATLNGYSVDTDPALFGGVLDVTAAHATITGIKSFTYAVTIAAGSETNLGLFYKAANDQELNGLLTVDGVLNLTSKVFADAGVTVSAGGTLNMAGNDIEFKVGGQTFLTAEDIVSTGGKLYVNGVAATINAGGSDIPYVTVKGGAVTLASDVEVGQKLDIQTGGSLTGAFTIFIPTLVKTVNGATVAGGATVEFTGSTLQVDDAAGSTVTWPNVVINSDTAAVTTIESLDDPITLIITGALTMTLGNIDQGDNDISLTGAGLAFDRSSDMGTITQADGALIFDGTLAQTFDTGEGFSIKNLTNSGDVTLTKVDDENPFTVTGNLDLVDGELSSVDEGLLHLAAGATILIDAANAGLNDEVPTFDGPINVVYQTTGGATDEELPTGSENLNNLTIDVATTLAEDATVNGTLFLNVGLLTTTGQTLTIDSGATIVDDGGDISAAPSVTNYNLIYTANGSTEDEFVSGKIDSLGIENAVLDLASNGTVKNVAMTKTGSGVVNQLDLNNKILTVTGNLDMANGDIIDTGSDNGKVKLGGTVNQIFTIPSTGFALNANLELNNAAGFQLNGGILTMNETLIFVNGVLKTSATSSVKLIQDNDGQGFDHSAVVLPNVSHIYGKVRHTVVAGSATTTHPNGRYVFPVGTDTDFREFAINFAPTYPATTTTDVIVSMVDESPEGSKNLPITAGENLKIGSYPDYYWLVQALPTSFSQTQLFDVDVHGTNIGIPYDDDQQLRIIRRQDGSSLSNGWDLQNGSTYSNYSVYDTEEDTTAVVRTTASIGGITYDKTRFTIGVPTRAPIFTAPEVLADTVNEGATSTMQFAANAQDIGETIKFSLVGAPAWATIGETTGLLTMVPDFTVGRVAPYLITVRATDYNTAGVAGLYTDQTVSIIVVDANRIPAFTTAPTEGTIKYGSTLTLTYVAADSDGDAVTYSVTSVPAPSVAPTITAALGVVTFTPAFADAGNSFVFEVVAADGKGGADTASTVVTVQYAKEKGDVNLDGSITSADATPILKYVVGSATLTDEQQYYAKVNSDDQIGSLDAAWVLYYAVNGSFPSAKVAPAIASTEFGQLSKVAANSTEGLQVNNGEFTLPVSFKQTTGVVSVYAEFQLSGAIDFESVTPRLPEGWLYASSFENGVLKIAMAGVNPLSDGNIANINVKMMDKEATGTIQGFTKLNDNVVNNLNAIKVKEIPAQFALSQNYPNPFNPTTSIKFQLPENANVTLEIYNMLGQRVKSLINGQRESGYYTVNWDGTNDFGSRVSSGIYIYRISAGKFVSTLKMNLLK